jgi:hypothetical protein
MQRVVVISYPIVWIQESLRMRPIGCPETSIGNYHYSLRNNPEERSSQFLRGGSLKCKQHSGLGDDQLYWLKFIADVMLSYIGTLANYQMKHLMIFEKAL